jgi:hypothetical protein
LAEALVAAKRGVVAIYISACRSNIRASDRSVQDMTGVKTEHPKVETELPKVEKDQMLQPPEPWNLIWYK